MNDLHEVQKEIIRFLEKFKQLFILLILKRNL